MAMAEPSVRRRRFLAFGTGGLLATLGSLIVAPAVAFVTSPLWKRPSLAETGFADAGPLDALVIGEWKLLDIEILRQDGWSKEHQARSVWVLRHGTGDRDVTVLSPICTHLGCPVAFSPERHEFLCPCHGGIYSNDGVHIGGPPPRNMDSLAFEVRAGRLWVQWQDFKVGIPHRVEIQV